MTSVICGAGGFIGGHLVASLKERGAQNLRAIDIKPLAEWHQLHPDVENLSLDLSGIEACRRACENAEQVYNLACDMGGMGFIENNKALCMLSVLINTHLLMAARDAGVSSFFYSSSACVYAADKQATPDIPALREEDAYPATPEDGYGWEKLFSERMCRHFTEDYGLPTRVARLHNVYGPFGTWQGGREKAPAAICRKVIEAVHEGLGQIEIWGDGTRTRSFTWIGDTVSGIHQMMDRNLSGPLNLGSSEMVTINQLADIAESIAGVRLERDYQLDAALGVPGRSSDNTLIRELTEGWEPSTPLRNGLDETYRWIEEQYLSSRGG